MKLEVFCLIFTYIISPVTGDCSESLGASINGYLKNSAFSASSQSRSYNASQGRLGKPITAWIPLDFQPSKNPTEYLQVDLGKVKTVSGVKIQGLSSGQFYVTEFSLAFSNEGELFNYFFHAKSIKLFEGNTDSKSTAETALPCKVTARYIRFKPTKFKKGIALRVDVLGCDVIQKKANLVKDLQALSVQANSMDLIWSHMSKNIAFVYVSYFPKGTNEYFPTYQVKFDKRAVLPSRQFHKITGLQSCTEYSVFLRVYDHIGCGIPEVHKLSIQTSKSKPLPPDEFVGDNSLPEMVMLTWKKSRPGYRCADEIDGFVITYNTEYDVNVKHVYVSKYTQKYNLTNLHSWKKYAIKIASYGKPGQSDWLTIFIDVDGKPPEAPPVITELVSPAPKRIKVTWKDPPPEKVNGPILGHLIYHRINGSNDAWEQIGLQRTNQSSALITVAKAWEVYEVYVSLFNQKHKTTSKTLQVLVKGQGTYEPPQNISVSKVTTSTINLHWIPIPSKFYAGPDINYDVYFAKFNEDWKYYKTVKTPYILIENLLQGHNYNFKIAGKVNDALGPFSNVFSQATARGPLRKPIITEIRSDNPGVCFLAWKVDKSVVVTEFVVHYKKSSKFDTWFNKSVGKSYNATIDSLDKWVQYDFQVEVSSLGRRNGSIPLPILIKGAGPGRPPTNITAYDISYTSMKISWNEINPRYVNKPIIGYGYYLYFNGNSESNNAMNRSLYRNLTLKDLRHDTDYRILVAGISKLGVGVLSKGHTFRTLRIIPPEPPVDFDINEETRYDEVKFRWTAEKLNIKDITSFRLMLTHEQQALKNSTYLEVTVKNHSEYSLFSHVVRLQPYTEYNISIKSCIHDVCGLPSPQKYFRTPEGPAGPVSNLSYVITGELVTLYWKKPRHIPGIVRGYKINLKRKQEENIASYPKQVDDMTFEFVLDDLLPNSEYKASLKALTTMDGEASYISFRTPESKPGKPRKVEAVLSKADMISVRWESPDLPNGVITGYKVFYEGSKYYNTVFRHVGNVMINSSASRLARISNLVPGTRYKVWVSASTSKGFGDRQEATANVITKVSAPKPPPVPTIFSNDVSDTTVTIRLQPAEQIFGPIDSYEVIVEILPGPQNDDDSAKNVTNSRRRRNYVQATLPHEFYAYDKAMQHGMKFYITASILSSQVPAKFVVGDGKIYQGYMNQPLEPESFYKVHIRATTKDGSVVHRSPLVSIPLPKTAKAKDTGTNMELVIILVIIATSLIVAIIIIICVVKYYQRSKREPSPFELGLVRVHEREEAPERPISFSNYPTHPDHPPIPVSQFPKQVNKLHLKENNGFKAEYNQLSIGKSFAWEHAHRPENKPKNRYANIVAYDHSRVILSQCNGSDYINASYIDGYSQPNAYIATQGPVPSTFNDFWRMVWEVRSTVVVMLTNLQEKNRVKCHKYWPDDMGEYGALVVHQVKKEAFASYVVRTFRLEKMGKQKPGNSEVREVRQFHFTCWPDHGVPQYPTALLNFRKKVKSYELPDSGPVVVHCSAGVGRTGAYLVIDSMLDRLQHRQDVDIFNCVASMRTRRIAMVQTEDQYIFVHDAIVEAILVGSTLIKKPLLKESIRKLQQIEDDSKICGFEKQWKVLNHANPILPKTDFTAATLYENSQKNRYSTVLPSDASRVLLLPLDENESTTYINAVYVDGFRKKNAFILTQSPLTKTLNDFWRMICEHRSSTIIMLNTLTEGDDYPQFWPESGNEDFDMINVECLPESSKKEDYECFVDMKPIYRTPCAEIVTKNFKVTDLRNPQNTFRLRLFQYMGWTETRVPNSCKSIVKLLRKLEKWQQAQAGVDGPVTLMCSDGLGRSGTLAAIIYVLERLKSDQEFDAFQSIKSLRIQRPHIVKHLDQFKYIHSAVLEYIDALDQSKC